MKRRCSVGGGLAARAFLRRLAVVGVALAAGVRVSAAETKQPCADADGRSGEDVTIENARFRLVVGADALVRSLVVKATGEECVPAGEKIPVFSVTQDRPFNNEVKLIHPNKRTTYPANSLRREGDRLVAGFETAPYQALVDVTVRDEYVAFALSGFQVDKRYYGKLKMDAPPVRTFRVLQLPLRDRRNFGDWLNAAWDDRAAVGVVGTMPETDISHERRNGFRILYGDLHHGIRLRGGSAALIGANGREDFLDCMDRLERDFDLPLGVESRRSPHVNASIYHTGGVITPANIDMHIKAAKKGGFRYMTFMDDVFTECTNSWGLYGNYDMRATFSNGVEDVKTFLARVKREGIHPGLHILATHIGRFSRYVTPRADPRLNLTRHFTLARSFSAGDDPAELEVLEPTTDVVMCEPCRILKFGTELFSYESYTTERPYRFLGVKRGVWKTDRVAHARGDIGGILDVSEFGRGWTCYANDDTDIVDEIADKIAKIYNCGFEYVYFDGAEGVNRPFNYHVANAIYRIWKKLRPAPLFSEGAAKTHFGWHIQSGANAFDCFRPDEFKRRLAEFPCAQAPLSWQDMTRVNFGWWALFPAMERDWGEGALGTQPDMWEYGEAKSYAWDCPATILSAWCYFSRNQRTDDLLEVMRRWEDVRARQLFPDEVKLKLRNPSKEHHLYVNEQGEYELHEIEMLPPAPRAKSLRGFVFERGGKGVAAYWDVTRSSSVSVVVAGKTLTLDAAGLKYLGSEVSKDELKKAFAEAVGTGGYLKAAEVSLVCKTPSGPDEKSRFMDAVGRLRSAFSAVSGIEPKVYEEGSGPTSVKGCVFLGDTAAAKEAGIDFALDSESKCRVRIVEDCAYLLPRTADGIGLGVDEVVRRYLAAPAPGLVLPCADFDVRGR